MKTILLLCLPIAVVVLTLSFSRHATAAPGHAVSAPLAEAMSSHGIGSSLAGSDGDAVGLRAVAYTPANP